MTQRHYTWSELQEIARKHSIIVEPPPAPKARKRNDPGVEKLRQDIAAEQAKKTAAAPAPAISMQPARVHYHYVRGGGSEEYLARRGQKGQWVKRDSDYWEREARQPGTSRILPVYDLPDQPTVITNQFGQVIITRGCLVDGDREVTRPSSPIRFAKLWMGSMCISCHRAWEALTPEQRQPGLFVVRRLDEEGFLPADFPRGKPYIGIHPIQHDTRNWRTYTWAHRVMRSDNPERQLPGTRAFFYLPGKLKFAEGVNPEAT